MCNELDQENIIGKNQSCNFLNTKIMLYLFDHPFRKKFEDVDIIKWFRFSVILSSKVVIDTKSM